MIFQIGRGGDGKGMEAILDRALVGDLASSTLDCGLCSVLSGSQSGSVTIA